MATDFPAPAVFRQQLGFPKENRVQDPSDGGASGDRRTRPDSGACRPHLSCGAKLRA